MQTHIHVQTPHAHTGPHAHTDLHTQTCTRTKTHTHACVHKSSQTHIDVCTDRHTNTTGPLKAHTRPRAQKRARSDTQTHTQRHRCRPLTYSPTQKHDHRAPEETPPNHTDTHMQKCTHKDPRDTTYTHTHTHTHTHTDSSLPRHTHVLALTDPPQAHMRTYVYMCIPVLACLPRSPSRQRGPGVLPAVLQRIHSWQAVGGLVPDPGRLSQQRHCVSLPLPLPSAPFLPQETNMGGGGPQSSRKGHCGGERSDPGLHLLSPCFCSSGLLHSTLREPPKDLRL